MNSYSNYVPEWGINPHIILYRNELPEKAWKDYCEVLEVSEDADKIYVLVADVKEDYNDEE